jgi:hypothetical protein
LAFENLYEDLAPVRFACDVLFWRLERPLVDAAPWRWWVIFASKHGDFMGLHGDFMVKMVI